MKISDLHGNVERCWCTNWDPTRPMPCDRCFCRGYVAACLQCNATGMTTEAVAGGAGKMQVTCPGCGGKKVFGVNKPAEWDARHPEQAQEMLDAAAAVPEPEIGAGVDKVYPDAKTALKARDAGWVQPPPHPTHVHNTPVGESITSVLA